MSVQENLQQIKARLSPRVTLVAVSKTKPNEAILEAYECGHRDFGENYVQELVAKQAALPENIHWHFIGHLQSNKVKYIAPFVYLIHGVDKEKLLREIDKQAAKNGRIISCLLQVHVAREESKFGFTPEELQELLESNSIQELKNVSIKGIMGMASNTEDENQIRYEFRQLRSAFELLKKYSGQNIEPTVLSMGMSGDYHIAMEEGSTMIRVGSLIFGERNYQN